MSASLRLFFCKGQILGKEAWIFTNPTDHMVTEMIEIEDAHLEDLLGGLLMCSGKNVLLSVPSLDVCIPILTQEKYFLTQTL
jgi:hypothetical protein